MKIIALTGGIGAGKSSVLKEFEALGAFVLDADEISRDIMQKGGCAYDSVVSEFGDTILNKDGEIDRKALAEIVFSDEKKLEKLNEITHTLIYREITKRLNETNEDVACIEIPLLFTTKCPLEISLKVAVIASDNIRIKRVTERDGCEREKVLDRMSKQLSNEEMTRLADCVIVNEGSEQDLKNKVIGIYNRIFENN